MLKNIFAALPLFMVLVAAVHAQEREQPSDGPTGPMHRPMAESVVSLHDLMEPIWRAPKADGAARACANSQAIQSRVDAAVGEKGTGPFLGMSKMANSITQACKENRMQDVSKLLDDLHRQFHKMAGME